MIWRDKFSIMAHNRRRGGQNFEEKNWRGVSRDSFFLEILSPSEPILRAKIENMISPDYVLCYIPRAMAILSWKWNLLVRRRRPLWCHWRPLCGFEEKNSRFWNFFPEVLNFLKILKIMSYNFQSRKQILTLRGVYELIFLLCCVK